MQKKIVVMPAHRSKVLATNQDKNTFLVHKIFVSCGKGRRKKMVVEAYMDSECLHSYMELCASARAREHSSRIICLRLWKDMWHSFNSKCGIQLLEGFHQRITLASHI